MKTTMIIIFMMSLLDMQHCFSFMWYSFFFRLPEGRLFTANHAENLRNLALVDNWE